MEYPPPTLGQTMVPMFTSMSLTLGIAVFVLASWVMLLGGKSMAAWWVKNLGAKLSAVPHSTEQLKKQWAPLAGIGIVCSASAGYFLVVLYCLASMRSGAGSMTNMDGNTAWSLGLLPGYVVASAALGWKIDWSTMTGRRQLGLSSRMWTQFGLAAVLLFTSVVLSFKWDWYYSILSSPGAAPGIGYVPFSPTLSQYSYPIESLAYEFVAMLVLLVVTSNAVNCSNGLAAGLFVQAGLFIGFTACAENSFDMIFRGGLLALAGACAGLLCLNPRLAKVPIGRAGLYALGAALSAGAFLTHTLPLLPFVGFVFYVELIGIPIQAIYLLVMSPIRGEEFHFDGCIPLHRCLELAGWNESQVVLTFYSVNLLTSLLGLALWDLGYIPHFP